MITDRWKIRPDFCVNLERDMLVSKQTLAVVGTTALNVRQIACTCGRRNEMADKKTDEKKPAAPKAGEKKGGCGCGCGSKKK